MTRRTVLTAAIAMIAGFFAQKMMANGSNAPAKTAKHFEFERTDAQWRAQLTPEQYAVLRHQATELPWSSPLEREHRQGTFACAGCELALFSSATKFDSGTGWPSFWAPLDHAVETSVDNSLFDQRSEVHCRRCGGHLGHVFNDGPKPTGLRYCMNGVALDFHPKS